MDGDRFDRWVRGLAERRLGRRQLITRTVAVGAIVGGVAGPSLVRGQGEEQAASDDGVLEQQFPCPVPGGPFDWLCGSGPFGPWYPMVSPPELTAATGIRWHGVQSSDQGGLVAKAFTRAGQEVSAYESEPADGGLRWSLGDAAMKIDGFLKVPDVPGESADMEIVVNGSSFVVDVEPEGGFLQPADDLFELDARQALLVEQWLPAAERLDGLLELGLRSAGDPLEASNTGCAVAGFVLGVTWVGCLAGPLGCLPAGGATAYIANKCTDEW
jgi:hypothetical protein